jgi:hypothetical protein
MASIKPDEIESKDMISSKVKFDISKLDEFMKPKREIKHRERKSSTMSGNKRTSEENEMSYLTECSRREPRNSIMSPLSVLSTGCAELVSDKSIYSEELMDDDTELIDKELIEKMEDDKIFFKKLEIEKKETLKKKIEDMYNYIYEYGLKVPLDGKYSYKINEIIDFIVYGQLIIEHYEGKINSYLDIVEKNISEYLTVVRTIDYIKVFDVVEMLSWYVNSHNYEACKIRWPAKYSRDILFEYAKLLSEESSHDDFIKYIKTLNKN